jgi:hypothetical protein
MTTSSNLKNKTLVATSYYCQLSTLSSSQALVLLILLVLVVVLVVLLVLLLVILGIGCGYMTRIRGATCNETGCREHRRRMVGRHG